MDKVLLKDLRRQDKYTKFFKEWQNQEFKDHPDESRILRELEILSKNIGMREGFVIACFDYRNLSLAFFTGNVEEITGYPESIFRTKGMEASLTLVHPDDRPELFRFHKIIFDVFHQLTLKERNGFEFSYTTRWVHRKSNDIIWTVGKAKPFLIDSDGNFAIDLHIIIQLQNHPKITSYDWSYSYRKEDGSRVYVTKDSTKNNYVKLTKKEKQIAQMILDGKKSKEVSEILNISMNTVGTHRKNILKKLSARNLGEMIKILASYEF